MSLNEGTFVKPLKAEGMEKVLFIFLLYKKGSLLKMATPSWDSHFRLGYQVYSTIRSFHSSRSLCLIVEPSWIFPERLMLAGLQTRFVSLRTALLNEGVFSSPSLSLICFFCYIPLFSLPPLFSPIDFASSPHIPTSPLFLPQCCFPLSFCPFHPESPCALFCISITMETLLPAPFSPLLLLSLFSLQVV